MATLLPQHWTVSNNYVAAKSLQSAALDDVLALAVLAVLSAVYLARGTLWDCPDPHLYKMYERPQEKMGSNFVTTVSRDVSERMQQTVSTSLIVSFSIVYSRCPKERRYRCLLGFSIGHRRTLCRPAGKGNQATLRQDDTRC